MASDVTAAVPAAAASALTKLSKKLSHLVQEHARLSASLASVAAAISAAAGGEAVQDNDELAPAAAVAGTKRPAAASEAPGQKKRGKPPRDPDMPKRPDTGYLLFTNEARSALPKDMLAKDVMVTLGAAWKALTAEERAVFNDRAAQSQAEYKLRMEAYRRTHPQTRTEDGEGAGVKKAAMVEAGGDPDKPQPKRRGRPPKVKNPPPIEVHDE